MSNCEKSGILMVFCLVGATLYMAFAFPYTLLHLKQSETTEIKAVIVIARNSESSPNAESYFIGEEPNEKLQQLGYDQLTNTGKERMYLLGKYLKLKYYNLLLNGNPRKIYARSADSDRCLESTQSMLAGLLPPKENWIWSSEMLNWQPKAIYSAAAKDDDLLSSESNCAKFDVSKMKWKNSTTYMQLISEFRHDLQTLRQNTGLEFEDDLEMLTNIEKSLKTRLAFDESDIPSWYTTTYASRLAHIADVATGARFKDPETQRLYSGRLMHEILEILERKIRLGKTATALNEFLQSSPVETNQPIPKSVGSNSRFEPNMFIYMTDQLHLSSLMDSLQVYSSQPEFGSLLLIELHHDPVNEVHFLRLFTLSSSSFNVFPEPVRVNPIACGDSIECEPQQFEQNMRYLTIDKISWQTICADQGHPTPSSMITSRPVPVYTETPFGYTTNSIIGQDIVTNSNSNSVDDRGTDSESSSEVSTMDELEDKMIVGPIGTKNPDLEGATTLIAEKGDNETLTPVDKAETTVATTLQPQLIEDLRSTVSTNESLSIEPIGTISIDASIALTTLNTDESEVTTLSSERSYSSSEKALMEETRDVYFPEVRS